MNLNKGKYIILSLAASGSLLVALFLLLGGTIQAASAAPGEWFVTPGGSGDCSQSSPCSLATALDEAGGNDTVYMAAGTYTGSGGAVITATKSITLYGGWDGSAVTPPVLDPDTYPTTVNGEGTRRGVYIGDGITVTLEGFTVTEGWVIGNGGGLYARNANLTLRGMSFYSNTITNTYYSYGGGAYVDEGVLLVEASSFRANSCRSQLSCEGGGLAISHTLTTTVEGSLFQDNDAWEASGLFFLGVDGSHSPFTLRNSAFVDNGLGNSGHAVGGYTGAMQVINAQARIEDSRFTGNFAHNDDGAVSVYYSELLLERNLITGNQCAETSGLLLYGVSPFTVTNNIIAGNQSTYYWRDNPAVRIEDSRGQFLHNTIARNVSTYGIQVTEGSYVTLTNTILVSHTVGISVTAGSTATLEGTLWGSGLWANGADWGGEGSIVTGTVNIWGDPAFVNPDSGNYHIWSYSAAVDAGVDAGVTEDIDGDLRPVDAGYDIGADETNLAYYIYLPVVMKNYP